MVWNAAGDPAGETAVDVPQVGPEEATDRVALPVAVAASRPRTAQFSLPDAPTSSYDPLPSYAASSYAPAPDEVTHRSPLPPFPPGGPTTVPPPGRAGGVSVPPGPGRSGRLLVALGAVFAVVLAVSLAALLWPGGGGKRPVAAVTASVPSAAASASAPASPGDGPSGGTPAPQVPAPSGGTGSGSPPRGAIVTPGPAGSAPVGAGAVPEGVVPPNGLAMPYRTVQQDQGYFEGTVTVTNRTSAPLSGWELSFGYPGAQVRTVWGGVLLRGGSQVIIGADPAAGPIPPGATYVVRFGAGGVPSTPVGCRFAGRECGFTP
jgi:hypothetical protein